ALNQCLGIRIGLGVQPLVGMAIAPEKTFKPKHIPILRKAHDHWPAGAGLKETHPTQNQGAHNALPKLCLADQQCAQSFRRDDQGFDLVLGGRIDESRSSGKRETWADPADLHECLARTIETNFAKAAHALDIRRLQNWKHLVTAIIQQIPYG